MAGLRPVGEGPAQLTLDGFPVAPVSPVVAERGRLFAKVVVDPRLGGCHHWVGAIGDDGYGRFRVGAAGSARTVRPHLRLFELVHGLRPVGVRLLHSCDETGCVALAHLRVGTQAQNMAQMHRRGRGGRCHASAVDLRGPAGRARAIRAALADGWDEAAFTVAVAAGDPFARQLTLPIATLAPATPLLPEGPTDSPPSEPVGWSRQRWQIRPSPDPAPGAPQVQTSGDGCD